MFKNLFLALTIGLFGLTLVVNDAEARRFGGGKSFGRSLSTKKPAQSVQQRQNSSANPAATSNSRRWLGPLGGLIAGGLIGALLFGDFFEGFQFMDFLIIAALLFGAFWLFKSFRRGAQPMARQAHATAGGGGYQPPEQTSLHSGGGFGDQNQQYRQIPTPKWFNEKEFLQGAKSHFIRLQAAWDAGDMKDIREYTTPELFAELTLERQSYQGERQFTEVVELNAELEGLTEADGQIIASVRYSGLIREEQEGEAKSFTEIWHVQRALADNNANWYVSGIQQES